MPPFGSQSCVLLSACPRTLSHRSAPLSWAFTQHSCRNAEVVEAFCRVAASQSDTRDQFTSRPLLHFTRLSRCPLHYLRLPGMQTLARRLVLASRLPSRAA